MKIYKYGNYDQYKKNQTDANIKKENLVWVEKSTIEKIYDQQKEKTIHSIICHGTRNGKEQKFFKEYFPSSEVIGTEISHTAEKYEMTVQHDFHEEKEEWIDKFDIVYSNSYDHSYDPKKSILAWKNQLKEGGTLYVETSFHHQINISNGVDCLKWDNEEEFDIFLNNLNFNFSKTYLGTKYKNILYRINR